MSSASLCFDVDRGAGPGLAAAVCICQLLLMRPCLAERTGWSADADMVLFVMQRAVNGPSKALVGSYML